MHRTVLITGAARNTGSAIARRFAKEGYNVCITSRSEHSAVEAAQKLQEEYPDIRVLGIAMEQSNLEQIEDAFLRFKNTFGRLDVFVANAADLGVGYHIYNTTPEDWDRIMNANVRGIFLCCQQAAKQMTDGGAIVFISSVHANQSIVGRVAYSTSKAALGGMMRSLALELANQGIRVNSLIAGAIWTERWAAQTQEETQERRKKYPTGKESSPEEIASATYFLASPENGFDHRNRAHGGFRHQYLPAAL